MIIEDIKPLFPSIEAEDTPLLIAGPCSAESRGQVLETAKALAAFGVKVFRAGVWKPRTKPGGFEGIGSPALSWLSEAGKLTGMSVVTEVATGSHLLEALDAGIDAVWIGARTTANPFAVQEIADTFASLSPARRDSVAVLVKNPVNTDLELWIGAIERLYEAGVRRIGAVHRGFSAYGTRIYRNPPEWRIPLEFHRRLPQVPLLCDPSHIGGKREFILPLAQRAMDMNFDGLIIESHCHPDEALSDSLQQILPSEIPAVFEIMRRRRREDVSSLPLEQMRRKIDDLDDRLLDILSQRMAVAREIGEYKKQNDLQVVQKQRYSHLMQKRQEEGEALGLGRKFITTVLSAIHEESVRQQLENREPENQKKD